VTRGWWRSQRAAFRSPGRDRGASSVELVILAPIMIIVSLLIVQYAIWFDARHAALAAAQEGDLVAREDASVNQNEWRALAADAATSYFRGLGTRVITGLSAKTGTSAGEMVSVTVSGKVTGIFPLGVSVTVSGPVECFRTQVSHGAGCAP
jgi:Flp pilus assembly protein TadG